MPGPHNQAYSNCLKIVAAAAKIVESSSELIPGSMLSLKVPHAVESLLNIKHAQHFSPGRHYEIALLSLSNPHILHGNSLNPASLLPLTVEEEFIIALNWSLKTWLLN